MLLPGEEKQYSRWMYPLVIAGVSLAGIFGSWYVGVTVQRTNERVMLDRVATFAEMITPDEFALLHSDETDLYNPVYLHLKDELERVRAANSDIRFIYFNGIKDGKMFFYADSENPESKDYSPPGQIYDEATDLMYQIFATGEKNFEFDSDRWGFWISAYAPVIDRSTGKVVALAGLDIPGESYITDIIIYSALPLLFTLVVLSFVIATQYVRNRERRYLDQKAEFLFIASHEIRTPLTGIKWATESVLISKESLGGYSRRIMEMIRENSVGLITRVNNLLDVSSFERGKKVALNIEEVPLRALLERVKMSLDLTALARKVALVIDSSVDGSIMVRCDSERIWHVFVNLISNGIKYTNPDTEVRISYEKTTIEHLIHIQDHGNGLTSDEQKYIFEGYRRTREAKLSQEYGTGLGLYLSENIAKLHGGKIIVSSNKGEGSTFTVVLKK